jgi:predicted nucleotidyltransferase
VTSRRASSRAAITTVARALAEDRHRVVFVGGTVTALYDLESGDVRPTLDVDGVVDVATLAEYYQFVERLRARGFQPCTDEGAPLCRLVCHGIRVDIVATVETGIGPTNRWYRQAVADAAVYRVDDAVEVLAITPLYFVATKLEAFHSRGQEDFQASHDLEDVLTVLSGISRLRERIATGSSAVEKAVKAELLQLFRREAFVDAVPGHFEGDAGGQERATLLLEWFATIDSRG